MMVLKSAAGICMLMAAVGVIGCNGHDRDHDRTHLDEHRDPPRDVRPCDHDHDPHCDDRPGNERPR
jgi:hypothetical protein